ncbi:MAG: ribonuclease HIII [Parachlamydiaceae bacterium]
MKEKDNTQPTSGTFVAKANTALAPKMIEDLKDQGFDITKPAYTLFQAKKTGVSCTFYESGKLTVQGKGKGEFIEFYLEPTILQTFSYTHKEHVRTDTPTDKTGRIGIDESGKGDFFGPLCIAGVYASGDTIAKLEQIGVKDSKQLSEASIMKLAAQIREHCQYHIVKINPPKYNELITKFGNLNHLLAWGHATAIEHLSEKSGCHKVIIDQFADERVVLTAVKRKKLSLDITQRHRAEEDVVVAAASILARWAFVDALYSLEKQFNQTFPKGASSKTIAAGRQFIRTYGREALNTVGKLHFKTLDSILNEKRE